MKKKAKKKVRGNAENQRKFRAKLKSKGLRRVDVLVPLDATNAEVNKSLERLRNKYRA